MKQKVVMCFGTFDLLHLGHFNYFQQAKKYGDYLIVVVARDKTKLKQKKKTLFSEQERVQLIQQIKIVDEAALGYFQDHYRIIMEKKPDIICLGYDQQVSIGQLKKWLDEQSLVCRIIRLKPFKHKTQKSSLLKHKIGLFLQK
jgi:FAD synthetase